MVKENKELNSSQLELLKKHKQMSEELLGVSEKLSKLEQRLQSKTAKLA